MRPASGDASRFPVFYTVIGGITASVGLELFLHPHDMIAGGVTGISRLMSLYTKEHFGLLLFVLNLPLMLLYSLSTHKPMLLRALPGLFAFSGSAIILSPFPAVSGHPVVCALGGGICIGLGAGLAARHGGLLDSLGLNESDDGRPSTLMLTHRKIPLIQIVMLCNGVLLITAGFVLGWKPALYSALSCLAAYETTRLMFTGLSRMVCVVSKKQQAVEDAIHRRLRLHSTPIRSSTLIEGKTKSQSDKKEQMATIYSVHLLDLQRFKTVIQMADPEAEIMYMKRWEQ
ncbi:YitT family protein [Paenibacillus sp. CMAA1739]|uniref:YitT family protein n=1 Tax=Paenibacillus ottowii TaxID=2315729 RepID=UPI0027308E24|nr:MULTISPECIES: YitT family protein [Paenibacillus]MDP1509518.1 YitT family protein [Paenibacillus ottowii]MEC4567021.1 YitT family protein [Paenibacillus sp. CMAA1739]